MARSSIELELRRRGSWISVSGIPLDVPVLSSINVPSLILTIAAMLAVFRFKIGMIPVLAACSAVGLVFYLASGHGV
jgi:chromate transporter